MRILSTSFARAPVRFDPAGGGTDAPPYRTDHGGCVVNISIARYIHARFDLLAEGEVSIHSCDLERSVRAPSSADLCFDGDLDLVKALVKRYVPADVRCRVTTQSDIPNCTGLGGSGALGVAVLAAITRGLGQSLSRMQLAEFANRGERVDLGFAGGSQDSYGAAFAGAKEIVYEAGGGTTCQEIPLSLESAAQLEHNTLLIYTGATHLSGSIHDDIKHSYALPDSPTVRAMDALKAEAARMAEALREGDLATYVDALNRSREAHYALHPSCDSDELRRYFSHLAPYILGGKTCGAGGGGFIAVYVKPECRHEAWQVAEGLGGLVWPLIIDRQGVVSWSTGTKPAVPVSLIGINRSAF